MDKNLTKRLIVCGSIFVRTSVDASCRSEEHTSELQSPYDLVCRLLLEKKKCQTNPDRGARPVRGAGSKRSRGASRVGARVDISGIQRELLRDRGRHLDATGVWPGCDPTRPPRRVSAPARAGGPWPRCPHGDPSVAHEGARGTCRRAHPPSRSFFFAVAPAPELSTLSLHDALPI